MTESSNEMPALPEDIAALLPSAREVPVYPAALRRSVLEGVVRQGAGPAASESPGPDPTPSASWLRTLAIFGAGIAVGFGLHVLVNSEQVNNDLPSPETQEPTAELAPMPAPTADETGAETPIQVVAPDPAEEPEVAAAPPSTPRTPAQNGDLAEELRLMASARAAVTRGNPTAALPLLREHETRFPRGQLIEERQALMIQALALSGQREAALGRKLRFERRFPSSPFLEVVRYALEESSAAPATSSAPE